MGTEAFADEAINRKWDEETAFRVCGTGLRTDGRRTGIPNYARALPVRHVAGRSDGGLDHQQARALVGRTRRPPTALRPHRRRAITRPLPAASWPAGRCTPFVSGDCNPGPTTVTGSFRRRFCRGPTSTTSPMERLSAPMRHGAGPTGSVPFRLRVPDARSSC